MASLLIVCFSFFVSQLQFGDTADSDSIISFTTTHGSGANMPGRDSFPVVNDSPLKRVPVM